MLISWQFLNTFKLSDTSCFSFEEKALEKVLRKDLERQLTSDEQVWGFVFGFLAASVVLCGRKI